MKKDLIINLKPPKVKILKLSVSNSVCMGIQMRPVAQDDGEIVIKPVMFLALTYDHRIIDGKEAVTFLKSVADKIQDPNRLLLGF